MRASRLLQMLLLLQNRGRMTCGALARELEVTRRTVLRDVDALTEAGLPVVVSRGRQGGVELGFDYRTRLTGLAPDEAEALGVILSSPPAALDQLGMRVSGRRAVAKLLESFPDPIRERVAKARREFKLEADNLRKVDPRIAALADAVRHKRIVYIRANTKRRRAIQPCALKWTNGAWAVCCQRTGAEVPLAQCGDVNISAHTFADIGRKPSPRRR